MSIGRQTAEIEAELKRLKLIASSKINRSESDLLEKLLQKLNFTRFYCKDKLAEDKQLEFNWWAEGWEVDEEPIALTKGADSDVVCYQMQSLLETYTSLRDFESDWPHFWSQVEHYFRALIVEGVKVHTNESKLE